MKSNYITIFPESYGALPVSMLLTPVNRLLKKIKGIPNSVQSKLHQLPQDTILSMLADTELIDKSLRSCVKVETLCNAAGIQLDLWTDVSVHEYGSAILLMELPPLVNVSYRNGEYGLSKRAEIELFRWFTAHKEPQRIEGDKFLYIYKRFTHILDSVGLCDNDNWEAKRITNAVTHAICFSDSPRYTEFFYTTVKSDYDGAELLVIRHSDLSKYLDYLALEVPIHPDSCAFAGVSVDGNDVVPLAAKGPHIASMKETGKQTPSMPTENEDEELVQTF